MPYKDKEKQRQYFKDYDAYRRHRIYSDIRTRRWWLKSQYGLTEDDYNKLLEEQNFSCALCRKHLSTQKRRLCVDHDHETGKVRGLLCARCNGALGKLGDTVTSIKRVLAYVSQSVDDVDGGL
jgi:Recombination endonuclease VII